MEKVDAASSSFQGHLFLHLLLCFRVTRECTEVGTAYLRTFSGFTHSYVSRVSWREPCAAGETKVVEIYELLQVTALLSVELSTC